MQNSYLIILYCLFSSLQWLFCPPPPPPHTHTHTHAHTHTLSTIHELQLKLKHSEEEVKLKSDVIQEVSQDLQEKVERGLKQEKDIQVSYGVCC